MNRNKPVRTVTRFHDIAIDALVDEQDAFGPASTADLERQTKTMPAALARRNGAYRRRGEPLSTEILIGLTGEDLAGRPLRTRHAVVHPQGQMPLTGLGVAMVLERLLGLDGNPAVPAGLYFPYRLLDSTAYFARLAQSGGRVLTLEVQGERDEPAHQRFFMALLNQFRDLPSSGCSKLCSMSIYVGCQSSCSTTKLFTKFARLSSVPTGKERFSGLGLSIVKALVELHGGKVWASSAGKGKGATLFVSLPL